MPKLDYPEFVDLVQSNAILGIAETKLDGRVDSINVNGYEFFSKDRKKFKRKSGGLGIFIAKDFGYEVEIKENESDCIMWVQLSKNNFKIILGVVYIPPKTSSYYYKNVYDEFIAEYLDFKLYDLPLCIMGDFNARTGASQEEYQVDSFLFEDVGSSNLLSEVVGFKTDKMLSKRKSKDKVVNEEGRELLDFCNCINLVMLNGRFEDVGEFTSVNDTVIDYILCNSLFFEYVQNFNIDMYDPIKSDVHSVLEMNVINLVRENRNYKLRK